MSTDLWDIMKIAALKLLVRAVIRIPYVISLIDEKGPMRIRPMMRIPGLETPTRSFVR
jgi:hypothetical protein